MIGPSYNITYIPTTYKNLNFNISLSELLMLYKDNTYSVSDEFIPEFNIYGTYSNIDEVGVIITDDNGNLIDIPLIDLFNTTSII